jgi:hypothetical protein
MMGQPKGERELFNYAVKEAELGGSRASGRI